LSQSLSQSLSHPCPILVPLFQTPLFGLVSPICVFCSPPPPPPPPPFVPICSPPPPRVSLIQGVRAIHGDRTQGERQDILRSFKKGEPPVLVATDVASRGLDIPAIKTVVNYDVARRADDHTHRIGRTGRAGSQDGTAYTLVTHAETDAAVELVRSLRTARQVAADDLLALARRSSKWKRSGLDGSDARGGAQAAAGAAGGAAHGGGYDVSRTPSGSSAPPAQERNEFAPPPQLNTLPPPRQQQRAPQMQYGQLPQQQQQRHQFAPPLAQQAAVGGQLSQEVAAAARAVAARISQQASMGAQAGGQMGVMGAQMGSCSHQMLPSAVAPVNSVAPAPPPVANPAHAAARAAAQALADRISGKFSSGPPA